MAKGKPEFRAEFVLCTQLEGCVSAASGDIDYPLPVTSFGRKALTVKALLTFAALKVGHCDQAYVHTCDLAMALSAIDDGTFNIDAVSNPREAAKYSRNSPSFRRPPA